MPGVVGPSVRVRIEYRDHGVDRCDRQQRQDSSSVIRRTNANQSNEPEDRDREREGECRVLEAHGTGSGDRATRRRAREGADPENDAEPPSIPVMSFRHGRRGYAGFPTLRTKRLKRMKTEKTSP